MTYQDTFSLLGGIGLFLFGMTIMSSGLKNACGNNLQNILEKATTNRAVAIFVGIAVTILIQSSSATDVMVIGFVNAGLMSLMQAVGVIMGATYLICYMLMQLTEIPAMGFGIVAAAFCIVYSIVACILAYTLAPKTFKLRN